MTTTSQVTNAIVIVGSAEIQKLLGISRQWATALAARPDFPTPIETLEQGRIWDRADIIRWAEANGRTVTVDGP